MSYLKTTLFPVTLGLAVLAGCSASPGPSGGGTMNNGTAGSAGSSGVGSGGMAGAGDPKVCTPGIPSTSQIPRLANAEYDAVVRDLLGVTTLASAGSKAPSSLLVPDFDGSLTDIAWNSYLVAAQSIAAEVMTGPNKARFIACDPAAAACLTDTIKAFGRKAFRRPLSAAEVTSFERLNALTPAGTPAEVAEAILFAFLASPAFITLAELAQDAEGTAIKLSSSEVATRLSFLLWGSVPDDALNAAADAGQLASKDQILAQAGRMIQLREKTGPVVAAFHRVYADIREGSHWGTLDHDTARYPNYSPDAVAPMMAELNAFFENVAFEGGSFKDLLLSNVGFVSKSTAPLYGLDPATYGAEPTRVLLDPSERPGFLTRVGFLSSYSSYGATSPILRGAFITSRIIGTVLGPPPAGATETPIPPGNYTTNRQAMVALTSPANCVGCHGTYVNPPGFVLEKFNAVGSVQTVDPLGGPIDGSADVYFGEANTKTIRSPLELMTELSQGAEAKRHYAEQWVSYATGRLPNTNDACVVDQLSQKLSADGYSILNLLVDLTQADSFRLRTVGY